MAHSHIHTEADLDAALAALGKVDPRFVPLIAKAGRPPLRRRSDGFAGLAAIIVAQQLSTASARPSGDGSPQLSIRSIRTPSCVRVRRGWRGSDYRHLKSAR